MNLARGLERRLENLVDGASASVFRGRMHPVVIGNKIIRQLDFLVAESLAGPQIPNDLVVSLNPSDIDSGHDRAALIAELEGVVTETARSNGWRMVGPPSIHLRTDPAVPKGVLACAGEPVPGPLNPWMHLIADDGSAVLPVSMNRTLIGRGLDCDIRLSNEQISRRHAIVFTEGASAGIIDLASSNGTFVNSRRVGVEPLTVGPGDHVVLGDLSFTARLVA
ncbi:MAG: DUF3662 domain-containing protein [Acidimicrobiia bacterium]